MLAVRSFRALSIQMAMLEITRPSIAIDSNGYKHISYYDAINDGSQVDAPGSDTSSVLGSLFPSIQQEMWDFTLQSPLIPTVLFTFPIMIIPMTTSSTPPVQAVAQHQAIGTLSSLKQQVMLDFTLQLRLIPTMRCIFPTMLLPMPTSSMLPVQAVVQPQAIGTLSPSTLQDNMPQCGKVQFNRHRFQRHLDWPSMHPTTLVLSTFPILMMALPTSSMLPVQAVAQPQVIGTGGFR